MTNIAGTRRNDTVVGDDLIPTSFDLPPPTRARGAEASVGTSPASDLATTMLPELLRREGNVDFLYLDSEGYVTTGIGNLVRDVASARSLPFVDPHTGKPATPEQVDEAFRQVQQLPKGYRAGWYASKTDIRLPEGTVRALALARLDQEFLPGLRREFSHFDSYPPSAQRALVDMAYNMGVGRFTEFPKLCAACEAGDWATAAAQCHRRGVHAERNDWTRDLFLQANVEATR